ncbi:MAG: glycoside hydrolase family 25 protein [Sphingomonadaceae bacterium]|nr:glycoside hydrolase family 25 protein [Sphingomonadaceae bacterium]MCP5392127.1 glycoside hydrolase family 25 protein [Sphingomonadaceae bacterium]
MGRRRGPKRRWAMRVLGALLLAGLAGGAWFWWDLQHWTPPLEQYPDQGALVGEEDGTVKFRTLRALGANFVYLEASQGANAKDARFTRNYAAAREAGLQIGAVHRFDPCVLADGQSANFVTTVPRAKDLLPPAIELDVTAQGCPERVSDAAVQSELMTLINQVETHTGKPVILKLGENFEQAYGVAMRIERNLWLDRTRFEPTYAGRPWLMWSANDSLMSEADEQPIEWVVVQP